MNEQTVLMLLSKLAARLLDQVEHRWSEEERTDIATRLADGAWNALVILLRQALAHGVSLTLDEFGRIERSDSGWSFEPAASLVEAAALARPPEEGAQQAASASLFYMNQALKLLQHVPSDIDVTLGRQTRDEFLQVLPGEKAGSIRLSTAVSQLAGLLTRNATQLRGSAVKQEGFKRLATKEAQYVAEECRKELARLDEFFKSFEAEKERRAAEKEIEKEEPRSKKDSLGE